MVGPSRLGLVQTPVLGLFPVDPPHTLAHLIIGVFGLVYARRSAADLRRYGRIMVGVAGLLTVLGLAFVDAHGRIFGHSPWNMADTYLHAALTLLYAYVGLAPAGGGPAGPWGRKGWIGADTGER